LPALNSVGTLLAHIAGVEAGWLYVEVLEQDCPPEIAALLPPTSREPDGHLTRVGGRAVAEYLAVLDAVRARLLAVFLPMSPPNGASIISASTRRPIAASSRRCARLPRRRPSRHRYAQSS
jgi:hypothetical protein